MNKQAEVIKELKEENKNLKSGHFCPSPQLGKLAISCNCVHSDRHRAIDWVEIAKLKEALEKIKQIEDAWDNCIPECNVCCKVQEIAIKALKGGQNE